MTNTRVHNALRSLQHDGIFLGTLVLLFAASSAVTILLCRQMSTMGGMPMPWMRMPGQSWPDVVTSFMSMWSVMMVAMMMPSLMPILRRYRNSVRSVEPMRSGRYTLLFCAAYFSVWVLLGCIVFLLGAAVTTLVLLVIDVMDFLTMTMVTAAITAERLTSVGPYVARVSGMVAIVAGLWMLERALL